jgi:hypothetical protein
MTKANHEGHGVDASSLLFEPLQHVVVILSLGLGIIAKALPDADYSSVG